MTQIRLPTNFSLQGTPGTKHPAKNNQQPQNQHNCTLFRFITLGWPLFYAVNKLAYRMIYPLVFSPDCSLLMILIALVSIPK
jgi:hypothetical protein